MHKRIIGWDVGGAHLKAALIDSDGALQQVLQVPCALWRGLPELEVAIETVMGQLNKVASVDTLHAITMTGELVDLFPNRKVGVEAISGVMDANLSGTKLFYAGAMDANASRFVTASEATQNWQSIASANWLASASFVAQHVQQGLFIDIGSTTSDFVLLQNNQPNCLGFTDATRMQTEELVYAGVVRTPLMALTQKVMFENKDTSIAAEYFATTADVYRLTGDLSATDDMADTADGQEKTQIPSTRRIARMIGRDVVDAPIESWLQLAQEFKRLQLTRLQAVATYHISRIKNVDELKIIGAGVGSFLVKEIAVALNIEYLDIADLIKASLSKNCVNPTETTHWAGICLPAVAVAYLALKLNKN